MKCPNLNELMDYTHGLLADEESAGIKTHIMAECGNCLENLRWLEEVAHHARQDRSFDFPEETIMEMVSWFKSQPAHTRPTVEKVMAKLIFDSLLPNQFAPLRDGSTAGGSITSAAGRQMLFQTDRYDVDLRFETIEDNQSEDLIGQILPQIETEAIPAGVTVQLWNDDREQMSTKTDNHGFFRFAGIPQLIYSLKIQIAGVEINLINLSTVNR